MSSSCLWIINSTLLAKPCSYPQTLKNCRYDLNLKTDWAWPRESLGEPSQAGPSVTRLVCGYGVDRLNFHPLDKFHIEDGDLSIV